MGKRIFFIRWGEKNKIFAPWISCILYKNSAYLKQSSLRVTRNSVSSIFSVAMLWGKTHTVLNTCSREHVCTQCEYK